MSAAARSQDRRDAILDAALACFDELGYERASIAGIRARSGASTGSIYHHFSDKRGIAAALFLRSVRAYQAALLAELGDDTAETVRGLVRAHLRWVEEQPAPARFIGRRRELEVLLRSEAELRELNRELFAVLGAWIVPRVRAGELRALSHEAYLSVVIGPCDLFARRWLERETRTRPSAIADTLADAAWRAVAGPAARAG